MLFGMKKNIESCSTWSHNVNLNKEKLQIHCLQLLKLRRAAGIPGRLVIIGSNTDY